jgi:hypothetical protein
MVLLIPFVFSCGKDDGEEIEPVETFTKNSKQKVNYTLNGNGFEYVEGMKYIAWVGSSSSRGENSTYSYSLSFADWDDNMYFDLTVGELKDQGPYLAYWKFSRFFDKGNYSYGGDTLRPNVSMTFADENGDFWYTDSTDNTNSTFTVTDTVSYVGPDWGYYKKVKANFKCNVAQSAKGPVKTITNGEVVASFTND